MNEKLIIIQGQVKILTNSFDSGEKERFTFAISLLA
jgi:hypothetical protein